jgi:HEAT repeat protein
MRLNIVISVTVLTSILVLLFWWASPRRVGPDDAAPSGLTIAPKTVETSVAASSGKTAIASSAPVESPNAIPEEVRSEQVAGRVAELMDLAMTDDPASLNTILSELNNSEPRIREAAVEAAVQFKSPGAVPALRDAAGRADDPEEKTRILKAIDFLSVPSAGVGAAR